MAFYVSGHSEVVLCCVLYCAPIEARTNKKNHGQTTQKKSWTHSTQHHGTHTHIQKHVPARNTRTQKKSWTHSTHHGTYTRTHAHTHARTRKRKHVRAKKQKTRLPLFLQDCCMPTWSAGQTTSFYRPRPPPPRTRSPPGEPLPSQHPPCYY